jgi:hypothetical protein
MTPEQHGIVTTWRHLTAEAAGGGQRKKLGLLERSLSMDTSQAADKVIEVHFKCIRSFSLLRTLRTVAQQGLAASKGTVYRQGYRLPETLERWGFIIPDKAAVSNPEFRKMMAGRLSDAHAIDAQSAVDSASIVFAHSALDACATELCELIADIAPGDWEDGVLNKRISLAELKGLQSYEAALKSVLRNHIGELARSSLAERLKLINQKCQPAPQMEFDGRPYKFDLNRLLSLDQRRHDIVHRLAFSKPDDRGIEDDLNYMEWSCFYLTGMVRFKYRLPVRIDSISRAAVEGAKGFSKDPR